MKHYILESIVIIIDVILSIFWISWSVEWVQHTHRV